MLLSAFAGLREHVPARLELIGADRGGRAVLAELNGGTDDVEFLGSVDDEELWRRLHAADVLCAPSLGGESFGMVLIEAFAAGTPVVASDIAGYRQVVTHGRDGLLVPPGSRSSWRRRCARCRSTPPRQREMGAAARARAADFAWPRVAQQVTAVYERAIEAPAPAAEGAGAVKVGLRPADLSQPAGAPAAVARAAPSRRALDFAALRSARRVALAVSA